MKNIFEGGCMPTIWETVSTNEVQWLQISKTVRYKKQVQATRVVIFINRALNPIII